jgi:hypothetical protein
MISLADTSWLSISLAAYISVTIILSKFVKTLAKSSNNAFVLLNVCGWKSTQE